MKQLWVDWLFAGILFLAGIGMSYRGWAIKNRILHIKHDSILYRRLQSQYRFFHPTNSERFEKIADEYIEHNSIRILLAGIIGIVGGITIGLLKILGF